jgi:hypothetical protein
LSWVRRLTPAGSSWNSTCSLVSSRSIDAITYRKLELYATVIYRVVRDFLTNLKVCWLGIRGGVLLALDSRLSRKLARVMVSSSTSIIS